MADIRLGNNNTVYKVGGNDCSIYLGTTLLYSGGTTPPTPPTPTGDTWVVYHAGDTIPAGQYGGVRISSATSIDDGACIFFLNTDYTTNNYIELGNNVVCTASECTEYCCNQYECVEWDEETGECIEETCYDWSDECCGMEECTDWADGYIMYVNDVETAEEFSFTDGYWTFDSYDLYVESSMQAPFDIELLVTQ